MFAECAAKMDIRLDTIDTMRGSMEAAGFTNVHERNHKMPKGEWCRNSVQKEIGKVHVGTSSCARSNTQLTYDGS